MQYQFTNERPIYLQIMDIFKTEIISGTYQLGQKIDSVRDLALKAKVNPNTMQKALSELERIGLVRTERNSGRFITEDSELINTMKQEIAEKEITIFLEKMSSLGFDKQSIINLINKIN